MRKRAPTRPPAPARRRVDRSAITFIGGGNMASALIGGLVHRHWPRQSIRVVEIAAAAREVLSRQLGVRVHPEVDAGAMHCGCVVLAVKPQQLRDAATAIRPYLASQLVLTIAAGICADSLSRWLGGYRRIVRAMPNTPALVHAGISGLHAGEGISAAERALAARILEAVGTVVWVEREEQLDAVTAVSGSGPAYVFYFIEALERAARELGLDADTAHQLALETFAGSARLAAQSGEPPEILRSRVTSRGGTTERALGAMEGEHVKDAIVRAVRAAAERSRELGDELGKS